jgi:hypothetical protein
MSGAQAIGLVMVLKTECPTLAARKQRTQLESALKGHGFRGCGKTLVSAAL